MAGRTLLFGLLLCVVVVTVCQGKFSLFGPQECPPKKEMECRPSIGWWWRPSRPRSVTLVVRNVFKEPYFEESATFCCPRCMTLFYMMQEAANDNSVFRFTVKYFGSDLGFFVQAINDVYGNFTLDKSYWMILDGENSPTPVGVSSYVPRCGETVTFNLTDEVFPH